MPEFTVTLREGAGRQLAQQNKKNKKDNKQQTQPDKGKRKPSDKRRNPSNANQPNPEPEPEPEPPPTPELLRRIAKQLEFYFSDGNLAKDQFLQKQMALDPLNEGWVSLQTVASFAKMKSMTMNLDTVRASVREKTKLLHLSPDGSMIGRVTPIDPSLITQTAAEPKLTLPHRVARLSKLRDAVAESYLGDDVPAQRRFPPSCFRQIGPVKIFLRRVSQMGTTGALKDSASESATELATARERVLEMVDQGAEWLMQIWDLEQIDEIRPTANHLGASLVFASSNLIGFDVPNRTKDGYRKAMSTIDKRRNELAELAKLEQAAGEKLWNFVLPKEGGAAVAAAAEAVVRANAPSPSEAFLKDALQSWLTEQIQSRFPGGKLDVYGSSASGLGLKGADLDLCLAMPEGKERDACRGLLDARSAGLFGLTNDEQPTATTSVEDQGEDETTERGKPADARTVPVPATPGVAEQNVDDGGGSNGTDEISSDRENESLRAATSSVAESPLPPDLESPGKATVMPMTPRDGNDVIEPTGDGETDAETEAHGDGADDFVPRPIPRLGRPSTDTFTELRPGTVVVATQTDLDGDENGSARWMERDSAVVEATNWDSVDEITGMPLPHYVLRIVLPDDADAVYAAGATERKIEVPCEDVHDSQVEGWALADEANRAHCYVDNGSESDTASELGDEEEEMANDEQEDQDQDQDEELFEDETRARRKLAARQVVLAIGSLLRPRCRKYVLSVEGEEERGNFLMSPPVHSSAQGTEANIFRAAV